MNNVFFNLLMDGDAAAQHPSSRRYLSYARTSTI
jgi:hypothetical protein